MRLPAPWGVGFDCWVREDGGIWQPIAMPVFVEKYAVGLLGWLCADGDGLPGRRMCLGESWKREGRNGKSGVLDDEWVEEDFQGSGR